MPMRIAKHDLGTLLERIAEQHELVVPVHDEGGGCFAPWRDVEPPDDGDRTAVLMLEGIAPRRPAKEVLFAQTATLFRYRLGSGDFEIEDPPPPPAPPLLFGVRPCDGRGFEVVDTLLVGPHGGDTSYQQARAGALLVGVGCRTPGPDCFCTSVGGDPHSRHGLNVLMTDIDDALLLEPTSERGEAWLAELAQDEESALRPANGRRCGMLSYRTRAGARARAPTGPIRGRLPEVLERSFESEVWEEVAPLVHRLRCVHVPVSVLPLLRHSGGRARKERSARARLGLVHAL